MKKIQTTVHISEKLRDLAKQNGLNISLVLEQALNISLAIPSEEKKIKKERDELLIKANVLGEKLEVIRNKKLKLFAEEKQKLFALDLIEAKKVYFSEDALNNPLVRKKLIDSFCDNHNLSREKAVSLILSKRKFNPGLKEVSS